MLVEKRERERHREGRTEGKEESERCDLKILIYRTQERVLTRVHHMCLPL